MRHLLAALAVLLVASATAAAQQFPQLQPLRSQGAGGQTQPAQPAVQSQPAQPPVQQATPTAPTTQPAAQPTPSGTGSPTTDREKSSYYLGINIATNLMAEGLKIDPIWLYHGAAETFSGKKPSVAQLELEEALKRFQDQMVKEKEERDRIVGEKNKREGPLFLATNKTKPGITTLPSGLQYQIIRAGNGPKPNLTDIVRVNYRGQLLDGTEFDTSYGGKPAEFPVNRVIEGWTEALQLMPTGSAWRLFVPAELAYKDESNGPHIGPNATLVFDVELMAIVGSVGATTNPAATRPATGGP